MSAAAIALVLALAAVDPPGGATVLQGVVVEAAPTTPQAARRYVDDVAGAPANAISLATWRTTICIEAKNLQPQAAAELTARIAARAEQLGVKALAADCAPNVSIVATSDGAVTAAAMVELHPYAFRTMDGTQRGSDALRRFASSDAPVRWWTISAQYDTEHRGFVEPISRAATTVAGYKSNAFDYFNAHLVRAMVRTIVVIDANRTGAASVEALGDYIARVVLAETDPEAQTRSYPTVLNLWSDQRAAAGMTAWDERYLKALYCASVRQPAFNAAVKSRSQLTEIARRMAAPPKAGPPSPPGSCD